MFTGMRPIFTGPSGGRDAERGHGPHVANAAR
jgi:hypothetical protein